MCDNRINWRYFSGLFTLFYFLIFQLSAKELNLVNQDKNIKLTPFIDTYIDTANLGIHDILNNTTYASAFTSNIDVTNLGFTNKNYWFRSIINNTSSEEINYVLQIPFPFLDSVTIYVVKHGVGQSYKIINRKLFGDYLPFDSRKNDSRYFDMPVKFESHTTYYLFINLKTHGEYTSLPTQLISYEALYTKESGANLLLGVYYGTVLLALFLTLFLGFSLKQKEYQYYLFYLLFSFVFQFTQDGLAFKYLFRDSTWWANHSIPISAAAALFFLLKFTQATLITSIHSVRLHKTINYLSIFLCIIFIIGFLPNPFYANSILFVSAISILVNITMLFAAISVYKTNYQTARYFVVAFSLLIIGIITAQLKNWGLLPSNFLTKNAIQLGSMIEIIFLSLALYERIKQLQEDRNKAQKQLLAELEEKNKIQQTANLVLEEKVKQRTQEIQKQKEEFEEINKELVQSITYARYIQESVLPSYDYFKSNLPNSFVLYLPKDIVSGDFYWFCDIHTSTDPIMKLKVLSVVDCTGHGVPGAFMSLIANDLLNQTTQNPSVNSPADVIAFMNDNIGQSLNKNNIEKKLNDGMDIAIFALNEETKTLYFAGANRPLFIIRNGSQEVEVIKGNRYSIGGYTPIDTRWNNHTIKLNSGDTFYIFSDGYADQFGGEDGKKLTTKHFKQLLIEAQKYKITEQKDFLEKYIRKWQNGLQQLDDILVVGVKME